MEVSNGFNNQPGNAINVVVNSGTLALAPQANRNPWLGGVVNTGGTLVLNCPTNNGNVPAINNTGGSIDINNGQPPTVAQGNSGHHALAIDTRDPRKPG